MADYLRPGLPAEFQSAPKARPKVLESQVIWLPFVNVPTEIFLQEAAQGHVKNLPFSLRVAGTCKGFAYFL